MLKFLVDDLGRIVGHARVKKNVIGNVEYGTRDNSGGLRVEGVARLVAPSLISSRALVHFVDRWDIRSKEACDEGM